MPLQDQWEIAPIFEKVNNKTLSFSDLMAQHNESRNFFPRLIFIALAFLTNWNVSNIFTGLCSFDKHLLSQSINNWWLPCQKYNYSIGI